MMRCRAQFVAIDELAAEQLLPTGKKSAALPSGFVSYFFLDVVV